MGGTLMMRKRTTLCDVKAYALENYEDGWHVLFECLTDEDIKARIDEGYDIDDFACLCENLAERFSRYFF